MTDFEELQTLNEEQHILMDRIRYRKEDLYSVKGVNWDNIPRTQRELDPTLKKFLYIDELETELADLYLEKKKLENKIVERLKLFDTLERNVLKEYYIFGQSISNVALVCDISVGQAYRVKREALEKYEKMYHS